MEISEILRNSITILSLLAAVLAWISKIRWSKEYRDAKEEIIRLKDNEIQLMQSEVELYKELNPIKLREYFLSVKQQLEEYNDILKHQLEAARVEIIEKEDKIIELQKSSENQNTEIEKVRIKKELIETYSLKLENKLKELRDKYESENFMVINIPRIDTSLLEEVYKSSEKLSETLTHSISSKTVLDFRSSIIAYANIMESLKYFDLYIKKNITQK
jgi:hypothetical protein